MAFKSFLAADQAGIDEKDEAQGAGYSLFDGVDVSVSMMGMNLTAARQESSTELLQPQLKHPASSAEFSQTLPKLQRPQQQAPTSPSAYGKIFYADQQQQYNLQRQRLPNRASSFDTYTDTSSLSSLSNSPTCFHSPYLTTTGTGQAAQPPPPPPRTAPPRLPRPPPPATTPPAPAVVEGAAAQPWLNPTDASQPQVHVRPEQLQQLLLFQSAPALDAASPWAQAVGCMPSCVHSLPQRQQVHVQHDLSSIPHMKNSGVPVMQQHEYQYCRALAEREAQLQKVKQEHQQCGAWLVEAQQQQAAEGVRLQALAATLAAQEEQMRALLLQEQEAQADLPARLLQLAKDRRALEGERAALQEARQELDHQVKVLDLAKTMKLLLASAHARTAAAAAIKSGCQFCLAGLFGQESTHEQELPAQQQPPAAPEQPAPQQPPTQQAGQQATATMADVVKAATVAMHSCKHDSMMENLDMTTVPGDAANSKSSQKQRHLHKTHAAGNQGVGQHLKANRKQAGTGKPNVIKMAKVVTAAGADCKQLKGSKEGKSAAAGAAGGAASPTVKPKLGATKFKVMSGGGKIKVLYRGA